MTVCRWNLAKDVVNMTVKERAPQMFGKVVGEVDHGVNAFKLN